jgi:hypothetical protein
MRILFLISCICTLALAGCRKFHQEPPDTAVTTVIINGLETSSQRERPCFKTANGPNYIDFEGVVVVKFAQGTRWFPLSEVPFSSPSTTNKFPVRVDVQMPNDRTPYRIEIYVKGKDCSRCARGWTAPNEPYSPCIENQVSNGYEVAYPRWAQWEETNRHEAQRVYNSILPDFNEPNTCRTCIVPL